MGFDKKFFVFFFVVKQVGEYRMTGIMCVLNQLAVSKQCWEAADISVCITCTAKLLEGTQRATSSTVSDLLTKFLGESTWLQTAGFLQGQ